MTDITAQFAPQFDRFSQRLALHTWTLESTPFPALLEVVRDAGWPAVEIRRSDVVQFYKAGGDRDALIATLRACGIRLAVVGTEYGLVFSRGDERSRLLAVLDESCVIAGSLGCDMIMTATGLGSGSLELAAGNLRAAGDVVAKHGLRLAWEYSSAHDSINTLDKARDLHARTNHPAVGLLLDAYHLERSGDGGRGFAGVPAAHIFAFQYSDVPPHSPPGQLRPTDRLPPGQGRVRWREVLQLLAEKEYQGWLSYEAPNPELWARPAPEAAREGLELSRALLRP